MGANRFTLQQWFLWLLTGFCFALYFQHFCLWSNDWTGLLGVPSHSGLRPYIESELGYVAESSNHDGQFYYVVARDPFVQGPVKEFFKDGYRYRRILLPLLGGGFGQFSPQFTLLGLIIITAFGFALTCAGTAAISQRFFAYPWAQFFALVNPCMLLSLGTLTPDALAFGLILNGVLLVMNASYSGAIILFCLGVLSKEHYLLIPIGIASWFITEKKYTLSALCGLIPTAIYVLWSAFVDFLFPESIALDSQLTSPFQGLYGAYTNYWPQADLIQVQLAYLTIIIIALSIIFALISKSKLLLHLTWPWVAFSPFLGYHIWVLGNNALRVVAPLWIFGSLGFIYFFTARFERFKTLNTKLSDVSKER